MTMTCTICNHPNRLSVDKDIVAGLSLTNIAKKYDVPYGSLYGHSQNHISRQLAKAWADKDMTESLDLLGRIDQIISRAEKIFRRNYDTGKDLIALKALTETRSTIELLAKISYSLHQAKVAELEASHNLSGQSEAEANNVLQERLAILTDAELETFMAIQMKLEKGNKNIIILKDPPSRHQLTADDTARVKRAIQPGAELEEDPEPEPIEEETPPLKSPPSEPVLTIQRTKRVLKNVVCVIPATPLQPSR